MDMELLWGFVVIGGPIILGLVIAWATLNNRRSAKDEARTEAATRQMYEQQNADDKRQETR
jgi:hypothetical protein